MQAGGAAAAVAPFLGSKSASAAGVTKSSKGVAPVITVFDHRGCDRIRKEYKGEKSDDMDDYMMVKLKGEAITVSTSTAASVLAEVFGQLDQAAR